MALSQSALSELLDAIRAGGSAGVMRDAMTLVLQQLIELEADQAIGAGRYERTEGRTTQPGGRIFRGARNQGRTYELVRAAVSQLSVSSIRIRLNPEWASARSTPVGHATSDRSDESGDPPVAT